MPTSQQIIDAMTARLSSSWFAGMPPRAVLPASSAACPQVRILHCWRRDGMGADILHVEATIPASLNGQGTMMALVEFCWESGRVQHRSPSGSTGREYAAGLSSSSVHRVARWANPSAMLHKVRGQKAA